MQIICRFKEKLTVLIHINSGQPVRAPEILNIQYYNTVVKRIRNIFIKNKRVIIIIIYYKSYQIINLIKIIY